jgi:hypothetical protein
MVAAAVVPVGTPAMEEMLVVPHMHQVLVVQAAAAAAAEVVDVMAAAVAELEYSGRGLMAPVVAVVD